MTRDPVAAEAAVVAAAARYGAPAERALALGRCAASIIGSEVGVVCIADVAKLYGRSRRWVYMRIKAAGISKTSRFGPNGSLVDLEQFVACVGLPRPPKTQKPEPAGISAPK